VSWPRACPGTEKNPELPGGSAVEIWAGWRQCLDLGIAAAKPGNRIRAIGRAIQDHAEGWGTASSARSSATGARGDPNAGVRRLVEQHQRVERVAVPPIVSRHVAVVSGEGDGAEQPPVEAYDAALLVVLVLVAAAARDLDDDVHERGRAR